MFFYGAQVIAFIGFLFYLFSFWQKKRDKILFFQLVSCFLYAIQYLMLMALNGAALNLAGMTRDIIFRNQNKKKYILFFVIFIYCAIAFAYRGESATMFLMPAAILYTIVLFQNDENKIRKGYIIVSMAWISYDYMVGAYVAFMGEFVLLTSNVLALIKYRRKKYVYAKVPVSVRE